MATAAATAGDSQVEARDHAAVRAGETWAQSRWKGLAGVVSHGEGWLPGDPEWSWGLGGFEGWYGDWGSRIANLTVRAPNVDGRSRWSWLPGGRVQRSSIHSMLGRRAVGDAARETSWPVLSANPVISKYFVLVMARSMQALESSVALAWTV